MRKTVEITLINLILSLLFATIIPATGFVVAMKITLTNLETRLVYVEDNKASNQVLIDYIKLIEERTVLQKELNIENKTEHKQILDKLEEINEKIHQLELSNIKTMNFRGNKDQWFYEDLLCFVWERGVTFTSLQ